MTDIRLDPATGDIQLHGGDLALIDGDVAIAQHLRMRLRFFQGEWFLDTRVGVPYFQRLLGHKPIRPVISSLFRRVILTTPGVIALNALAVEFDNSSSWPGRVMRVAFTATLEGSDGPLQFVEDIFI